MQVTNGHRDGNAIKYNMDKNTLKFMVSRV